MFLIITRNFPPDVGGIQSLMEGLSISLLDHGPVKVFAFESKNSIEYDKKSSLDIKRVKGVKLFRKYRKANLINSYLAENIKIRAIFFDHWKSLELIKNKYLNKTKIFCLIHGKEINHINGSLINKRIVNSTNKADFVIANSNFTKELAVKIGINHSKIKVIFPGIKIPKKTNNSNLTNLENLFKDSFPKIITVARLEKRKNHEKVLMIVKNLKALFPKIKYISIGYGEEEENLNKLKKELNIQKEVLFLKNITEELKLHLISKANLFLMPSIVDKKSVEGFGISYIEAASYGIGSIGGKNGGESDAINNNITGLLCDGNNLNSIYENTITFFKNNNYLKFGTNAQKFSENFHWHKVVKNYIKLIN